MTYEFSNKHTNKRKNKKKKKNTTPPQLTATTTAALSEKGYMEAYMLTKLRRTKPPTKWILSCNCRVNSSQLIPPKIKWEMAVCALWQWWRSPTQNFCVRLMISRCGIKHSWNWRQSTSQNRTLWNAFGAPICTHTQHFFFFYIDYTVTIFHSILCVLRLRYDFLAQFFTLHWN